MNNYQIVLSAALSEGITTPEEIEKYHAAGYRVPLFTYAVWKSYGYTVKRGEKARLIVSLWKEGKKKTLPEALPEDADALPEEEKKRRGFFLKKCFLFDRKQVEKTEEAEARRAAEKEEEDAAKYEEWKKRQSAAGPRDISGALENIRYYIMDCDLSINKTAENMGLSAATIRRYIDESEFIDRDFYFDVTGRIEKRKREIKRKARAKMYAA